MPFRVRKTGELKPPNSGVQYHKHVFQHRNQRSLVLLQQGRGLRRILHLHAQEPKRLQGGFKLLWQNDT